MADLSPADLKRLCATVTTAILQAQSPWKDRKGAAAYLSVSVDYIDLKKRKGIIKPRRVGDKPLYHVTDLDKLPAQKKQTSNKTA